MKLNNKAKVFTTDGKQAGTIDRVVIDPDTNKITHIVVQKGFLFTTDKVIPMSMIKPQTEDKVTLISTDEDMEDFPLFEESHYVRADQLRKENKSVNAEASTAAASNALYWYPPFGTAWTLGSHVAYGPPYVERTQRNIPEGLVALSEGTKVVAWDGEEIGEVERVLTDMSLGRATHLLVSKGLLFKEQRMIPTTWIRSAASDKIRLTVSADFVKNLPEYQPER